MRQKRLVLALLMSLLAALAPAPSAARVKEAPGEYAARRARLLEAVAGPVVLFGYSGREEISPAESFRQEENFYYLTGHEEPGAALMEYTFQRAGCERPGYAPIVGSGFNSTVLHYDASRRQFQAGDLVVIDAAAECAGYTADIIRTLPVSGTFTPRQREIYEIVLGAQNAVLAAVKPGMSFARTGENSLYRIAYDYINTHGKDLKGEPLGKYSIHGLGHHIGLAVHDAGDPYRPLEPGMIVTIEPGIYIPEENLGVRLEDIVLVTETGAVHLTASLPRTVEEVEQAMAAARGQVESRKPKIETRK